VQCHLAPDWGSMTHSCEHVKKLRVRYKKGVLLQLRAVRTATSAWHRTESALRAPVVEPSGGDWPRGDLAADNVASHGYCTEASRNLKGNI